MLIMLPNEKGEYMPLISYQNSTYMPVRLAGEWMGKNMSWDGTTQTVALSGSVDSVIHRESEAGVGSVYRGYKERSGVHCPEREVYVDGEPVTFKNEKGAEVYPIDFLNVTYLPIRSIGELTGMEVKWVGASKNGTARIYLRKPLKPGELEELRAYTAKLQTASKKLVDLTDIFNEATPGKVVGGKAHYTIPSLNKAQAALTAMMQRVEVVRQLCQSDSELIQYYPNEILSDLKFLNTQAEMVAASLPAMKDGGVVIDGVDDMGRSISIIGGEGYAPLTSATRM